MTEEVKNTETVETKTEVTISPVEQSARDQGWVNKEEWVADGKEEDAWRPAKEFIDRGELYKSIHQTKRELKQTQATLTALQRHHVYVFESAHQKALDDLKKERRVAAKEGDVDRVEEVEEKIEQVQKEHKAATAQVQTAIPAGPHPDYVAWVNRNSWYDQDEDLREFADATGLIYMQKNPDVPPNEVLTHVTAKVKKQFPEKFGTKKAAPNAVTRVDKTSAQGRKAEAEMDLTETEQDIMKELVSSGVMTKEKYIAELKKVKDR